MGIGIISRNKKINELVALGEQVQDANKEKETIRKYAPIIQEQTARGIFDQLSGLAAYASNDGITVPQGVNVTNEEMQRARKLYGDSVNMQDILDMRKLDSLPAVNGGSTGAAPDGGLASILNTRQG